MSRNLVVLRMLNPRHLHFLSPVDTDVAQVFSIPLAEDNDTLFLHFCWWHGSLPRHSFSTHSTHYNDVIMGAIAPQIISLMIVFSTVYLDTDQIKHQRSASLAFVRGIHRRPVNSTYKWPVTRKMFPFDYVIMLKCLTWNIAAIEPKR